MRRPRNTSCRFSREDMEFGSRVAYTLHKQFGLPTNCCETAAATCKISLMGRDRHDHDGEAKRSNPAVLQAMGLGKGRWCHTRLMTHGNVPTRAARFGSTTDWSGTPAWIKSDSFGGADELLAIFGLCMKDVTEHFGDVEPSGRLEWTLREIVTTLAPSFVAKVA